MKMRLTFLKEKIQVGLPGLFICCSQFKCDTIFTSIEKQNIRKFHHPYFLRHGVYLMEEI